MFINTGFSYFPSFPQSLYCLVTFPWSHLNIWVEFILPVAVFRLTVWKNIAKGCIGVQCISLKPLFGTQCYYWFESSLYKHWYNFWSCDAGLCNEISSWWTSNWFVQIGLNQRPNLRNKQNLWTSVSPAQHVLKHQDYDPLCFEWRVCCYFVTVSLKLPVAAE